MTAIGGIIANHERQPRSHEAQENARRRLTAESRSHKGARRGRRGAAVQARHAEAQPPPNIHVKTSPLVFASMTGDVDNVRLLLARGADPAGGPSPRGDTPISMAVTFGYADVVRMLVSAGATVSMTERSGINLLHWAAITNRAAVIPALVEAGVPLNATDENGFTPIMYAATIDFGDAESLKALLKAGADRSIRNNDDRTALEQARYLKHAHLEAALR